METFSDPPILLLIAEACERKELGRWCCATKTIYINLKCRWPLLEMNLQTSSIEFLLTVGKKLQDLRCLRVLRIIWEPHLFVYSGRQSAVRILDDWAMGLANGIKGISLTEFSFWVHNGYPEVADDDQSGDGYICDEDICVLMDALPAGLGVLELALGASWITEQAGEAIARTLRRQHNLSALMLDLGRNSGDFCECLIGMIPANLKSLSLELDGTIVGRNATRLVESLPATLSELHLDVGISALDANLAWPIICKVPRCLKRFVLMLCDTNFVATPRSMQILVSALPPKLSCFKISLSGCVLGGGVNQCFAMALPSLPMSISCLSVDLSEMDGCAISVSSLSPWMPNEVSNVVLKAGQLEFPSYRRGVRQPNGQLHWTTPCRAPTCLCLGRPHNF